MASARSWVVLTVCAAALGGLAGAVAIVMSNDPGALPMEPAPGTPSGERAPDVVPPAGTSVSSGGGGTPPQALDGGRRRGLTQRIDSPDPGVRHALALELLRVGPDALPQARALRPRTDAGRDLHERLVLALDKLRLVRRADDYPKLAPHLRLALDLSAFSSVVPEELLVDLRLDYWDAEVRAVRARREADHAHPGEEALALLELACARRDAGSLGDAEYSAEAGRLLPTIEEYVAARRRERRASPAAIQELEEQVARLRP